MPSDPGRSGVEESEQTVAAGEGERGSSVGRVALAGFIGTAIEYYDFYIYGLAAVLIFPRLFFPELSPAAGLLASFATYGVAFVARPLGGALFGHFGDRVGRKEMLIFSLLLMGVSTFCVGLLPGYATLGLLAPLLLVVLRFCQGVGLGGEWGGAVLMAAEHAPPERRAFYSGFPQVGPAPGYVLSAGIFLVLDSTLSEAQFDAWGWRIPFLLSIVLVGVGLFVRARLAETPVFRQVTETRTEVRVPFVAVLRAYPATIALASLAGAFVFAFFYLVTVFSVSYGIEDLGLSRSTMLYCVMVAVTVMGCGILLFSGLSDTIGRRKLALGGTLFAGLWVFPMFYLLDTGKPLLISLGFSIGMFAWAAIFGPLGAFFSELFDTRVRYSGAALSFALGGVLGGALAPLIAVRILTVTGSIVWVATYLFSLALISLAAIYSLRETSGKDLAATYPEERAAAETR